MKHSMNDTTGLRMQKYNKHLIFGFLHITDASTFFAFFLNDEKVVRHDWRGCQHWKETQPQTVVCAGDPSVNIP